MTADDPAAIMAAHDPHTNVGNFTHCVGAKSEDDPHCLPYRLAELLDTRTAMLNGRGQEIDRLAAENAALREREQAFHNQAERYRRDIDRLSADLRHIEADTSPASQWDYVALEPNDDILIHLTRNGVDPATWIKLRRESARAVTDLMERHGLAALDGDQPKPGESTCRHGRTRCACLPNYGEPT